MVGLKYGGKKIPFIYEGENIVCGKMMWGERGQVIQVPREDAEEMVNTSPTDFVMIVQNEEPNDAPIAVLEKEVEPEELRRMEAEMVYEKESIEDDVKEEVAPEVIPEVTPEEVVKGPAAKPKAKKKGWPKGKKRKITKVEPFFQEHD